MEHSIGFDGSQIRQLICNQLLHIERDHNIRILYALESGSRAMALRMKRLELKLKGFPVAIPAVFCYESPAYPTR